MADNDDKEDGAEAAAAPKKSRKKLIIMAAAVLLLVGGGGATWFFFFRSHGEEMRAEVAAPKAPIFVDVPEVLVNLVGAPGERIQYLKVKVVLEVKEEKQVETIKPTMPRVSDIFQTYMRELRPCRPQRIGRTVSPEGRADAAGQCRGCARSGQRRAVQGNRHSVTGRM